MLKISFLTILVTAVVSLSTAQSLKVMTYNIRYATPADSVNEWSKRTQKVYTLIKKYDPDILGVQEALHGQLQDLVTNLPEYMYVGVGRDDGKTKGEYSAILLKKKRFKVLDQGTFWLSETPDVPGSKSWDAAITRVATWAKLKDLSTGKEFLSVNTHFDHIGEIAREKSAALLKEKVAGLRKKLPVIVTGDFNSQPTEPPYATAVNGDVLKLHDSRPASETQGTFCTFKVNAITCRVIDYIFYSDGWSVQRYQVITDNDGKYYPSDHLPVFSEMKMAK